MIDAIKTNGDQLLILDCGGFSGKNPKKKDFGTPARVALEVMDMMAYDAVNLGVREIFLKEDFFQNTSKKAKFSFISSNLVYDGENKDWLKKYVIKKKGNVNIAIAGVLPSDALPLISRPENINILPPSDAIKPLLPEIKAKSDALILLSYADFDTTAKMINTKIADLIDLIIVYGSGDDKEIQKIGHTPVLKAEPKGLSLGMAKLTVSKTKRASLISHEKIVLDQAVEGDDNTAKIIEKKLAEYKAEKEKKEFEKTHQQLMEGLKLSPEEFLQQLKAKGATR